MFSSVQSTVKEGRQKISLRIFAVPSHFIVSRGVDTVVIISRCRLNTVLVRLQTKPPALRLNSYWVSTPSPH